MKKIKLSIVILIIGVNIFQVGCFSSKIIVDNKIYSEDVLKGYKDNNKDRNEENFISANDAIDYSISIFKDIFKVEVDRGKLKENVNLDEMNGELYWSINWRDDKDAEKKYDIMINTKNKEILVGTASTSSEKISKADIKEITDPAVIEQQVWDMINPLFKKYNINLDRIVPDKFYGEHYVHARAYIGAESYYLLVDLQRKGLIAMFKGVN